MNLAVVAPDAPKIYSIEEYLDMEVASELRHEYRNGEIWEMTGGTPTHNELIRSLSFILSLVFRKQPYQIFIADQRLWLPTANIYTYPNLMIVPRPIELQAGRKDTVTNPVLIAEILSDATQAYDRGEKFAAYRTLETLQEYLLIDQHRYYVEQYQKQAEHQWLFTEHQGRETRLNLSSISTEIALADLYENLEFA